MARKSAADLRKAKEKKQKKLLIGLVPVFLLLVAWQGPKMYTEFLGGPPAEAEPAPTGTAPTETVPGAGAPAPAAPAPAGDALLDSDPLPAAGSDRLVSFSLFTGRDPFLSPYGYQSSDGASGDPAATPEPGQAVLQVNGLQETVSVGASFPASEPVFELVSVTEAGAVIGLVSGAFEGGAETVQLAIGEQVDLVADPDGTRYTVRLISTA